jgi:hypothetical protein
VAVVSWQPTIRWAVLFIGPSRCYKRKTKREESHFPLRVERDQLVRVVSIQDKKNSYFAEGLVVGQSSS